MAQLLHVLYKSKVFQEYRTYLSHRCSRANKDSTKKRTQKNCRNILWHNIKMWKNEFTSFVFEVVIIMGWVVDFLSTPQKRVIILHFVKVYTIIEWPHEIAYTFNSKCTTWLGKQKAVVPLRCTSSGLITSDSLFSLSAACCFVSRDWADCLIRETR